jgi:hypothetical protein
LQKEQFYRQPEHLPIGREGSIRLSWGDEFPQADQKCPRLNTI